MNDRSFLIARTACVLAAALIAFGFPSAASAATDTTTQAQLGAANTCNSQNTAFTEDDLSGFTSPCAAAPATLIIETVYFQNASRVGGTALAAYPLVRLRTGLVRNLELVVDPPSQVAESGLHGLGLYPTTGLGYGLNYTLKSNAHMAMGFGAEAVPQNSRFVPNERQSKYMFDFTAGWQLSHRTTISALATGTSSASVGFNRIMPAATVRVSYEAGPRTSISTDVGARLAARNSVAQSYGDIALVQRLRKNINYSIGLGSAFNAVGNAKAHYLASGFNFHLK